jgi:hypothetical protein
MNVYLIKENDRKRVKGFYKIGVAKKPMKRLSELQTGNPNQLQLVKTSGPYSEKQAFAIERELHTRLGFARMQGEWFKAKSLRRAFLLFNYLIDVGYVPTFKEAARRQKRLQGIREQQRQVEQALADEARIAYELRQRIGL